MSRSFKRVMSGRPMEEPTVNLTPLIDVVFVILIMFILVAPLLDLDRIDLADAPVDRTTNYIEVHETSPIAIHVDKDNAIRFNDRKVNSEELIGLLKLAKQQHPGARPQLFHDRRGHFGTYQTVKNALEQAGFETMDVILKPG